MGRSGPPGGAGLCHSLERCPRSLFFISLMCLVQSKSLPFPPRAKSFPWDPAVVLPSARPAEGVSPAGLGLRLLGMSYIFEDSVSLSLGRTVTHSICSLSLCTVLLVSGHQGGFNQPLGPQLCPEFEKDAANWKSDSSMCWKIPCFPRSTI